MVNFQICEEVPTKYVNHCSSYLMVVALNCNHVHQTAVVGGGGGGGGLILLHDLRVVTLSIAHMWTRYTCLCMQMHLYSIMQMYAVHMQTFVG